MAGAEDAIEVRESIEAKGGAEDADADMEDADVQNEDDDGAGAGDADADGEADEVVNGEPENVDDRERERQAIKDLHNLIEITSIHLCQVKKDE
jgi:hypothetical protein